MRQIAVKLNITLTESQDFAMRHLGENQRRDFLMHAFTLSYAQAVICERLYSTDKPMHANTAYYLTPEVEYALSVWVAERKLVTAIKYFRLAFSTDLASAKCAIDHFAEFGAEDAA